MLIKCLLIVNQYGEGREFKVLGPVSRAIKGVTASLSDRL